MAALQKVDLCLRSGCRPSRG